MTKSQIGPCFLYVWKTQEEVKWPKVSSKVSSKRYMTLSAGTKPSNKINPLVVEVMKEVGIDISNQKSKEITEDKMRNSEKIVNMGCMDKSFCPTLFIPHVIDWGIDPKGKPIEKVRDIRDEIDGRVRHLAAELNKDSMQANL
jgi:arsenate reductase (thioredoxin)